MKPASNDALQRDRALLGVRGLILCGSLGPGERVSEIPLSKDLGVSRTPLRIALDRLCREGLLETVNSGGFRVRRFFIQDVWDALELRGEMEGTAARLAAERLAEASELDRLRTLQADLEKLTRTARTEGIPLSSSEMARYGEGNGLFHQEIVTLAKSAMLRRTLTHLYSLPFAAPGSVVLPGSSEGALLSHSQHEQIIEAIAAREGTQADSLAREHARFAREHLKAALAGSSHLQLVGNLALTVAPEASDPVRWSAHTP